MAGLGIPFNEMFSRLTEKFVYFVRATLTRIA